LRTKKCGTGVSQVLKYSTGLSRSTKRNERRIMPSSPGNGTACPCGRAHVNMKGAVAAANAAPEICLRNSRLEFIVLRARLQRNRFRNISSGKCWRKFKLTPPARKRRVAVTRPAALSKGRRPSKSGKIRGNLQVPRRKLTRDMLAAYGRM